MICSRDSRSDLAWSEDATPSTTTTSSTTAIFDEFPITNDESRSYDACDQRYLHLMMFTVRDMCWTITSFVRCMLASTSTWNYFYSSRIQIFVLFIFILLQ
jgi:hypothetical protein